MAKTKILWTQSTWNPVTGCTKLSAGCQNCYAEKMAIRLKAMGMAQYSNGFQLTLHPEEKTLHKPIYWKKPQLVFVNSMSDLFHQKVPLKFINSVFTVMNTADWHIYQVLTKRSERLLDLSPELDWQKHIWAGVTVESEKYKFRIDHLRETNASVKFLSLEPLLSPLGDLNLNGIDWVIVGGESGPGARPMEERWVRDIHAQCQEQDVPFFFKQWSGRVKKEAGRLLDGRTWDEMPKGYDGNLFLNKNKH